jgi:hypothetical protein
VAAQVQQADARWQIVLNQCGGCLRQQHLASVAHVGNARRPVDGDAHIVVQRHLRLAGVHAHAHPHRGALGPGVLRQTALRLYRRSHGASGAGKRHEEGVPLGAHDVTAAARHSLAQDAVMLGQRRREPVAQAVEQLRGAFDVREEEGDRALGQVPEGKGGSRLCCHTLSSRRGLRRAKTDRFMSSRLCPVHPPFARPGEYIDRLGRRAWTRGSVSRNPWTVNRPTKPMETPWMPGLRCRSGCSKPLPGDRMWSRDSGLLTRSIG